MREIKFRAWSHRDKMWCGAFSIHKTGLFTEIMGAKMVNDTCTAYADWKDLKEQEEAGISVMEFTGLTDMIGKEIYEGDIVQCHGYPYSINVIKFENGMFTFEDHLPIGLDSEGMPQPEDEYEIIGNIYENPELLNGRSENNRSAKVND